VGRYIGVLTLIYSTYYVHGRGNMCQNVSELPVFCYALLLIASLYMDGGLLNYSDADADDLLNCC
jgi:hypothetical protein